MHYGPMMLAILAGFILPIQGALNSKLGAVLDHPMQSTLISYIGGFIACVVFLLIFHPSLPELKTFKSIEPHLLTGGFLGAVFVSAMLYLMPKIGVANMLAAAIVGQLIMSLMLDHFGAFGNPVIKVSATRVFGVLLLLAGLYFIRGTEEIAVIKGSTT